MGTAVLIHKNLSGIEAYALGLQTLDCWRCSHFSRLHTLIVSCGDKVCLYESRSLAQVLPVGTVNHSESNELHRPVPHFTVSLCRARIEDGLSPFKKTSIGSTRPVQFESRNIEFQGTQRYWKCCPTIYEGIWVVEILVQYPQLLSNCIEKRDRKRYFAKIEF